MAKGTEISQGFYLGLGVFVAFLLGGVAQALLMKAIHRG